MRNVGHFGISPIWYRSFSFSLNIEPFDRNFQVYQKWRGLHLVWLQMNFEEHAGSQIYFTIKVYVISLWITWFNSLVNTWHQNWQNYNSAIVVKSQMDLVVVTRDDHPGTKVGWPNLGLLGRKWVRLQVNSFKGEMAGLKRHAWLRPNLRNVQFKNSGPSNLHLSTKSIKSMYGQWLPDVHFINLKIVCIELDQTWLNSNAPIFIPIVWLDF